MSMSGSYIIFHLLVVLLNSLLFANLPKMHMICYHSAMFTFPACQFRYELSIGELTILIHPKANKGVPPRPNETSAELCQYIHHYPSYWNTATQHPKHHVIVHHYPIYPHSLCHIHQYLRNSGSKRPWQNLWGSSIFFVKSMRKYPEIGGCGPSCLRAPRVRKMRPVRAARLRGCWWPVLGSQNANFTMIYDTWSGWW